LFGEPQFVALGGQRFEVFAIQGNLIFGGHGVCAAAECKEQPYEYRPAANCTQSRNDERAKARNRGGRRDSRFRTFAIS
ncbi:MAG: hypothetical protein MUF06_23160, partial [Pirellulaceae bacterium]|nr:hypothetical protein [Pirellulaceae bacterium]